MKTFKEQSDLHPSGTYICADLSKESSDELHSWVKNSKINNPTKPEDYHVTITYSRKGVPQASKYIKDISLPIDSKVIGWKIFPTQKGGNCLVGIMAGDEFKLHHDKIRKIYGATHDYDEYHPHVTISYDYGDGSIPEELPKFDLRFDNINIEALDTDYVPGED